jgi:transcriptional regulator GlxA family with amidase domain
VTRVVFLLVPGLHVLDLAGPAQAFGTVADFGRGYALHYVAERDDVPTAQGVAVRASMAWPSLDPGDLILVPGWRAPSLGRTGPLSSASLARLAGHHAAGGTVASVCAGADALGRAGLLDGRRCTTHHDIQDELARRYPRATVIRDVLYVEDDRVATSAGIASGIDLALHLIAVRDHIEARFAEPLPLAGLARACGVSERTLTRRFAEATGLTPLRYQQLLRLERAGHLIGHGSTVEPAARAVGFSDARMLRRLRTRDQVA